MYMKPIVTFDSYGSPVFPLKRRTLPDVFRPTGRFGSTRNLIGESGLSVTHLTSASSTSSSVAPSKTGVATGCGLSAAIGLWLRPLRGAPAPPGPPPRAPPPPRALRELPLVHAARDP